MVYSLEIGTNEYIAVADSKEEAMGKILAQLTDEDRDTLKKMEDERSNNE